MVEDICKGCKYIKKCGEVDYKCPSCDILIEFIKKMGKKLVEELAFNLQTGLRRIFE